MKNKAAFTLIELLIVIAILGTLATFVVVSFTGAQATTRDTKRQAELKQYQNALEIYATRNDTFPADIDDPAETVCGTLGLDDCPSDPKINQGWQDYIYQSNASGLSYVLYTQLERVDEFFVLCSDGRSGRMAGTWAGNSSGVCPL